MDQQETIALFEQCEAARKSALDGGDDEDKAHEAAKAVWNAWAEKVLAEREELKKRGNWETSAELFGGDIEPGNNETRVWMRAATVDFSGVCFESRATTVTTSPELKHSSNGRVLCSGSTINLRHFIFPGPALFNDTTFSGPALFGGTQFNLLTTLSAAHFLDGAEFGGVSFSDNAKFSGAVFEGEALFAYAQFSGTALFERTRFSGDASFAKTKFSETAEFETAEFRKASIFDSATFMGATWFTKASFSGDVSFGLAEFHQFAYFVETHFSKDADFRAIRGERGFTLERSVFEKLPEFVQAHFSEAPRLDNLTLTSSVEGSQFWPSLRHPCAADVSARYRAIRRLAVQGHDTDNERLFLKGEIRARRLTLDKPWHALFWFGIAYDAFSDFGGAIARPILWGIALILAFAAVYYNLVFASCGQTRRKLWTSSSTFR